MTKKFLALTMVLVLAAGFAALAVEEQPLSRGLGVSYVAPVQGASLQVDTGNVFVSVPFSSFDTETNYRGPNNKALKDPVNFDVGVTTDHLFYERGYFGIQTTIKDVFGTGYDINTDIGNDNYDRYEKEGPTFSSFDLLVGMEQLVADNLMVYGELGGDPFQLPKFFVEDESPDVYLEGGITFDAFGVFQGMLGGEEPVE